MPPDNDVRETKRGLLTLREAGAAERVAIIDDLAAAIASVGVDRFADLTRALGWLDRIVSLHDLKGLIRSHEWRAPLAYGRNLETIAWMEMGAMVELCDAIAAVRSSMSKAELATDTWRELSAIVDRWQDSAALRHFRDEGGFHLQRKPIADGLKILAGRGKPVPLIKSEGERYIDTRMPLADAAIIARKFGDKLPDDVRATMGGVDDDIGRVMQFVERLVFDLLSDAEVV